MQTVTPGASHLEVTPIAYGTWQFGGDWEPVDEQAAVAGLVREGLTRHVGISTTARTRSPRSPRRPRRNRQHHGPAVPLGGPSLEGMT
jgi:aryl-alcohol dehydrogenase-like predicted oxidoreductase